MTGWTTTPLTTIALATTGIDPQHSEICGYAALTTTSDGTVLTRDYTPIHTRGPIPDDAASIHGITGSVARWGTRPEDAAAELAEIIGSPGPLVAFNAPWAFAHLAEHFTRYGLPLPRLTAPVLDPLVLDRQNQERAVAGNRTLAAVRDRWNLAPLDYGPAPANAVGAAELAHTMTTRIPQFRRLDPVTLSARSEQWYYAAEEDFRDYLRSVGKTPTDQPFPWPSLARPEARQAA